MGQTPQGQQQACKQYSTDTIERDMSQGRAWQKKTTKGVNLRLCRRQPMSALTDWPGRKEHHSILDAAVHVVASHSLRRRSRRGRWRHGRGRCYWRCCRLLLGPHMQCGCPVPQDLAHIKHRRAAGVRQPPDAEAAGDAGWGGACNRGGGASTLQNTQTKPATR